MFVVNDPYYGAVHHPDISLVAPIFHGDQLARLGRRRRAPGRHGRHEHWLDLGPRAGEAAGGPDDAADEADRPRAAPPGRLAADPEHDPPAADRRARPARLHRLERRRPRTAAGARRRVRPGHGHDGDGGADPLLGAPHARAAALASRTASSEHAAGSTTTGSRIGSTGSTSGSRSPTTRSSATSRSRRRSRPPTSTGRGRARRRGLRRRRAGPRRRDPVEPGDPRRGRGDRAARDDRQRAAAGGDGRRDDRRRLDGDDGHRHGGLEDARLLRRAARPLVGGYARDVRRAFHRRPQPARRGLRQPADRRADRRRRRLCGRRRDRPVRLSGGAEAAHRERRVERAARPVPVPVPRVLPRHRWRRHLPRRSRGRHGLDAPRGRAPAQCDHRPRRRGSRVLRPVRRLARSVQPADARLRHPDRRAPCRRGAAAPARVDHWRRSTSTGWAARCACSRPRSTSSS